MCTTAKNLLPGGLKGAEYDGIAVAFGSDDTLGHSLVRLNRRDSVDFHFWKAKPFPTGLAPN